MDRYEKLMARNRKRALQYYNARKNDPKFLELRRKRAALNRDMKRAGIQIKRSKVKAATM